MLLPQRGSVKGLLRQDELAKQHRKHTFKGRLMLRHRRGKREQLPVEELRRLMASPVPSEVIEELSEPVAKALLLHLVMEARYGK